MRLTINGHQKIQILAIDLFYGNLQRTAKLQKRFAQIHFDYAIDQVAYSR